MADTGNHFVTSLQSMLMEAFEFLRESQVKRNESKLKLISINKKIEEVESLVQNKTTRLELKKLKD